MAEYYLSRGTAQWECPVDPGSRGRTERPLPMTGKSWQLWNSRLMLPKHMLYYMPNNIALNIGINVYIEIEWGNSVAYKIILTAIKCKCSSA